MGGVFHYSTIVADCGSSCCLFYELEFVIVANTAIIQFVVD